MLRARYRSIVSILVMQIFRLLLLASLALAVASCSHMGPKGGFGGAETISLGGVEQGISVRGTDRDNPVLLFLHGGPGVPEMPVAWLNDDLEKEFTVVQWDERGAGKSSGKKIDYDDLTSDKVVRDALELTRKIRKRFGDRKVYLVGFSFGSLVGVQAVAREPEHYVAYVGLSQLINIPSSERRLFRESLVNADNLKDKEARKKLEDIGNYPYPNHDVETDMNNLQAALVASNVDNKYTFKSYLRDLLQSPDYSVFDVYGILRGYWKSLYALEYELYDIDVSQIVRRLDVPTYFISGKYDTILSQTVVKQFYDDLYAPKGKDFTWIDGVGHPLHLEKPAEFQKVLRRVKAETWKGR